MAAKEDILREVAETEAKVTEMAGKVDAAVQLIADLKAALDEAAANNTGLTAAEVQDMAARLDAAQTAMSSQEQKLDDAVAPAAPVP